METQKKRTPWKTRLFAIIASAALLVGIPTAAHAYTISGTGQSYNQTVYYTSAHSHNGGAASFRLDSHSGFCGSNFWLALRANSGDSTYQNSFTSTGVRKSFIWHTGSSSVPSGVYRITSRNNAAGCPPTFNWSGDLALT